MTVKFHWGTVVNSDVPVTGVLSSNSAEFLHEDALCKGIDIGYEEHCKECKENMDPDGDHSECYYNDEPTFLVGFKYNEETGEYEPDPEAEYSAIIGPQYTQVIQSRYVSRCELCSPCFPGQGDLDTPGEFLAYTLPPDVFGDAEHLPIEKLEEDSDGKRRATYTRPSANTGSMR